MRVTNNYLSKTQGQVHAGVDDTRWYASGKVYVRFCFQPLNGRTVYVKAEEITLETLPEGVIVKSDLSARASSRDEVKWVGIYFKVPQPSQEVTLRLRIPFRESEEAAEIMFFDFAP